MPRDLALPIFRSSSPSWEFIGKLANHFGASMQATAQRYVQLTQYHCWLAVLENGKLQRYQRAERSPYHLKSKQTFVVPRNADGWQQVSARTWMGHGKNARRYKIWQSFLSQNQYGETLTLLWDKENNFWRREMSAPVRRLAIAATILAFAFLTYMIVEVEKSGGSQLKAQKGIQIKAKAR